MFILGCNFVGGDMACALTPTAIENINYVEIKQGNYDKLFLTKDVETPITSDIALIWDFNTLLSSDFNNSTDAGNMGWNLATVSDLLIKSREVGTHKWKTIATKKINGIGDFEININDYLCRSGQPMEYAAVPVLHGAEGIYSIVKITPQFEKMFLIEDDIVWGTEITEGFCDTTRNVPSSDVELMNSKYPVHVRNTKANYDTGSCDGTFMPTTSDEEECELALDPQYDYIRTKYQREFMDFLCDGVPKILKLPDGRMWIVEVTPSPTDTANEVYSNRTINFNWVEIESVDNEEGLYLLGISPVTKEWWNK